MDWYYTKQGERYGPVSGDRLRELAAQGDLQAADLVWRDGMTDWEPLSRVGLVGATTPAPTPPPVPPVAASAPATTPQSPPRKRRRRSQDNARIVVWACVGGAAVLLCLSWVGYELGQSRSRRAAARQARPRATTTIRPAKPREQSPASTREQPVPARVASAGASEPDGGDAAEKGRSATAESTSPAAEDTPLPKPSPPSLPEAEPQEPSPAPGAVTPQARSTLYQEIAIHRQPSFVIQGTKMEQDIRYRILSRLDLSPQPDGTRKVVQIIEETRLEAADALSRSTFEKSLEEIKRQQYTFTLNKFHEVVAFTGHKKTRVSVPVEALGGSGFMTTSVIDEDGWKELAQMTFFHPDDVQVGETWTRQMTHDFGSLGSWEGLTKYRRGEPTATGAPFTFTHEMTFTPPTEASAGGLPFKITSVDLRPIEAGGTLLYSHDKSRIDTASETFHLQGTIGTQLAGIDSKMEIEEHQQVRFGCSTGTHGPPSSPPETLRLCHRQNR